MVRVEEYRSSVGSFVLTFGDTDRSVLKFWCIQGSNFWNNTINNCGTKKNNKSFSILKRRQLSELSDMFAKRLHSVSLTNSPVTERWRSVMFWGPFPLFPHLSINLHCVSLQSQTIIDPVTRGNSHRCKSTGGKSWVVSFLFFSQFWGDVKSHLSVCVNRQEAALGVDTWTHFLPLWEEQHV